MANPALQFGSGLLIRILKDSEKIAVNAVNNAVSNTLRRSPQGYEFFQFT